MEASPNVSPIDIDVLMEIMDGDQELILDCLGDFAEEYPALLEEIDAAIASGDDGALERCAHALKGSLKYLAASAAADVAGVLEQMGRDGTGEDRREHFDALARECERVKTFIEGYDGS